MSNRPFLRSMIVLMGWIAALPIGWLSAQVPDINEFTFVQQEPEPLNLSEVRKRIVYPATAVEDNVQGTVVARVLVDTAGHYVRHKLVKRVAPDIDAAVEKVLDELRFTPAIQDGEPVMFWLNLPFPFKLIDEQEEQIKERIEELTQELTVDPDNYLLWHKRAIQRSQLGDLEFAIGDFTESIVINPRKNKKRKPESYRYLFYAYFGRGQVYVREEEYRKGIADYTRALEVAAEMKAEDSAVQATVPRVYLERGYTQALLKNYEASVPDLEQALQMQPDQACEVYPLLADVGLATDDYELLVEAYDGLIACNPKEYAYFYSLGYYRSLLGQYERAIADMDSVTSHRSPFPLRIAAYNRIAWCHLQQASLADAEAAIEQALALNAVNHLSFYYRALLLEAQKKPDQACQAMRQALYFGLEGKEGDAAIQFLNEKCGGWGEG
jgi:tetratricopeptide (TPR) repeat protein